MSQQSLQQANKGILLYSMLKGDQIFDANYFSQRCQKQLFSFMSWEYAGTVSNSTAVLLVVSAICFYSIKTQNLKRKEIKMGFVWKMVLAKGVCLTVFKKQKKKC